MLLEGQHKCSVVYYTQSHYENKEGMASGEKDLFPSGIHVGCGTSRGLGVHKR